MKKISTVLVVLFISVTLFAACGNKAPEESPPQSPSPEQQSPSASASASPGGKTGETSLKRGVIDGSKYTNDFAKIAFTKPDKWAYASSEELASMMNVGIDLLKEGGVEFSKELLEVQVIIDMMAKNTENGSNVIVEFENLEVIDKTDISEEEYLNATKEMLAKVEAFKYDIDEPTTAQLGGQTYACMMAKEESVQATQGFYVRKEGGYMVVIVVSAFGEDKLEEILKYFS